MECEALLLGLAEVSIAITGFSGVVGAVGGKTWGEAERFRFINLTSFAIAATVVKEMGGDALLKKIEEDSTLGAGGIDALRVQAPRSALSGERRPLMAGSLETPCMLSRYA